MTNSVSLRGPWILGPMCLDQEPINSNSFSLRGPWILASCFPFPVGFTSDSDLGRVRIL